MIADLKKIAAESQLELLAVLSAKQANITLEKAAGYLKVWQERGYAGEMRYMERSPELFSQLENFLPGVKTILTFAVTYHQKLGSREVPASHGRIASYAWGLDYHYVIKKRLANFVQTLADKFAFHPNFRARAFTDAVPLLERALAASSKQGFVGRNSMFIIPGRGSYFFLADLLLTEELVDSDHITESTPGSACKTCVRCKTDCPTDAIVADRVVDARKCISYLTIEKKTDFTEWESSAIGDWLFGCDICQEVCPFNHRGIPDSEIAEFSSIAGVGCSLDLVEVLSIRNKSDFDKRFKDTALMRAGREALLRNACAVVANKRFTAAIPILLDCIETDSSAMVRSQAANAISALRSHATGLDRRRINLITA